MFARNWLQVPNTYDQPRQDQKQKVVSFNIAPGFQHAAGARTLLSVNAFFRRDQVDYYPSRNPFDDSPATLAQDRSLANLGVHADVARVDGRHNWKAGIQASQTRLDEAFSLGFTDPSDSRTRLAPFVYSRAAAPLSLPRKANISQRALFAQDTITLGNLTLDSGIPLRPLSRPHARGGVQPRGAFSYL